LSLRRDIALSHAKFGIKHLCPSKENETYVKAPSILKKKELDQLKNVICSIWTHIEYGSSLNKSFIVDGHITRFKTRDFHNCMKVLTSINSYCCHLITKNILIYYVKIILMNSNKLAWWHIMPLAISVRFS
jgi:hypothetical protein